MNGVRSRAVMENRYQLTDTAIGVYFDRYRWGLMRSDLQTKEALHEIDSWFPTEGYESAKARYRKKSLIERETKRIELMRAKAATRRRQEQNR